MMGGKGSTWLVPFVLVLATRCMQQCCVYGEPQVPGLFIFGDSLSDNGNNNPLVTAAKANYPPYGIDFPHGSTGRFTNGRTSIDIISQFLGFKEFIPPYANIGGSNILRGVNYASGAAGIRFESGTHLGADISLGIQLVNHGVIFLKIAAKLGGVNKAHEYLKKCLYYVNIGSNDYINNYFLPKLYPANSIYTLEEYAQNLIDQLSITLKSLHYMGARKYVLVGLGLIGCTPNAMATHKTNGSCVEELNTAAIIYNEKLKALVDHFNDKFSADSKFIFINTAAGGSTETGPIPTCCKVREDGQCVANETPCENRTKYSFFDQFHPTEVTNLLFAMASYNASNQAFTYPMDINQLVHTDRAQAFTEL